MSIPMQISFHQVQPSRAVELVIRDHFEKLKKICSRIISFRAVITQTTVRHRKGNIFHVRLDVRLPGREILVGHESDLNHAHEDPYVAIRDAFRLARRRVRDFD